MKTEDAPLRISTLVKKEWSGYHDLVKSTRKKISVKSVHALRVQIHKLVVALELSKFIAANSRLSSLIEELRKTQKQMSPLRDLQVELETLKNRSVHDLKNFKNHLQRRREKLSRWTKGRLKKVSLSRQKHIIEAAQIKWGVNERKITSDQVKQLVSDCIRSAFVQLEHENKSKLDKTSEGLHRLRAAVKYLCYLYEAQKSIVGTTGVKFPQVRKVQEILGRVQNDSVLLKNIDKYLKRKHHRKDKQVQLLKQKILIQQKGLVKSANGHLSSSIPAISN